MKYTSIEKTFKHLKICIMKTDYIIQKMLKAAKTPLFVAFLILTLGFNQLGLSQVVTGSSVCEGGTLKAGIAASKSKSFTTYGLYLVDGSSYSLVGVVVSTSPSGTFGDQSVVGQYEAWSFPGIITPPADPTSSGTQLFPVLYIFANPIPSISGSVIPCLNSQEIYETESGMTGYLWSVVNGNIVSGSGTYQVTVEWNGTAGAGSLNVSYTDGNGCTPNTPTVLSVDVKQLPIITITGPDPVCEYVTETYTTESGQSNYDWEVTNGTISAGGDGYDYANIFWQTGASGQVTVTYSNADGCNPGSPTVKNVTFNPQPNVFFTIDGNSVAPNQEFEFCFDAEPINMSIVDNEGATPSIGAEPFDLIFTVNGGSGNSLTDVYYDDIIDIAAYLPDGPYPGQLAEGTYDFAITSFVDANGCPLSPGALPFYQFSIIIHPQPDVFLTIGGTDLLPYDIKYYCETTSNINLAIVDEQAGNTAVGTPPFDLAFTINGGTPITLNDVAYDEITNLYDYLPTTGGNINPGTYVVQVTSFSDDNGCALVSGSLNFYNFTLIVDQAPVFSDVTMQYSLNTTGPWTNVAQSGNQFSMCIHPDWEYFYLDVNSFTSVPDMKAEFLNAFKLDYANLPVSTSEWEAFWLAKGVSNGGPGWNIITGDEPIFYLYKTAGGDYQLIDAFLLDIAGQGMNPLRLDGDYPQGNYHFTGTVAYGTSNCASQTIDMYMDFTGGVLNVNQEKVYCAIQPAINEAMPNDVIKLGTNLTEGMVIANKAITLDGGGFILSSTSATYGISVQSMGLTIKNITVDGAGTFGIHQQPNCGNLLIENTTVQNGGGTGFAMNCSDVIMLKNITSNGNTGNGVSITNCSNVTIDGITTSGNAFAGGFSAGIGIFSNSATCTPDGTSGVTLTGTVNIGEPVQVYEQATTGTIANVTLPSSFTYYLGFNADKYYYESLNAALAAADFTLQTYPVLQPYVYVKEIATGNLFVEAFTTMSMSIQAAINVADPNDVIMVGYGTFNENIVINKALILKGANADVACGSRSAESVIAPTSGLPVSITADGVTINGFELTAPGSFYAINCGTTSNTTIIFNNIHDIGTTASGGNVHSIIYTVANSTNKENVTISDNCFTNISSSSLTGFSSSAIGILQSSSTGVLTNLEIEGNTIDNVNVNTGTWPTGKIAYGIQLNTGGSGSYASTTGKIVNASIKNNTISNITGFIATGIGLEGNTENALVDGNTVTNLTGYKLANRAGGGYDINGLKFENNRYVSTVTVQNNSFDASTFKYITTYNLGYAVANYVPMAIGGIAQLGCNWYGTDDYGQLVAEYVAFTGKLFDKEGAGTDFVAYSTSANPVNCLGLNAAPANLSVSYTEAAENVVVTFDVAHNASAIYLIPGLIDPALIAAKYVALQTAIAGGDPVAIKAAALEIGDDIITEYYYMDGVNKVYLQTAGGNPLVKNKYWDEYLNNNSTALRYPSFANNRFIVPVGGYSTNTNPNTGGAVNTGWLAPVYGKTLYVTVTFLHNGEVNTATQSVEIALAPVVNVTKGLGYLNIQSAIANADPNNVIEVSSGTYNEQVIVNKGLTIKGVGATKPIVNFTGIVTGKPTLFDVSADGVTIENIHFNVDLSKLKSAIIASGSGIDYIAIKDNVIDCYNTPMAGAYGDRNAVSVNYVGTTNYRVATGGVDNMTFTGNIINFGAEGGFRSGISADEVGGTFSGNTLQTINHDILVRFASNGNVTVADNFLNGGGMEFADFNAGAGTLAIIDNQFNGAASYSYTNALRLKNNYTARPTIVSGNTFTGFVGNVAAYGGTLSLENYQEVTIDNNTFTPLASSTDFRHITINTKDFTSSSGFYAPVIGATLTKNIFYGSGVDGGLAIGFYNWDNDSPVFNAFVIGTDENENTFNEGITTFIYLDNSSGTAAPNNTTMVPWAVDLDVANNLFATSTPTLPAAMTPSQLFTLEDKVHHAMDFVGLGLVTWIPSNVYVTTNTLGIQRGIDVVPNSTVNVGPGTFNEDVNININGIQLLGSGIDVTTLRGTYSGTNGGSAACLFLNANNILVQDMTVTRDYGVDLAAWQTCTKNQGITFGQVKTGNTINRVKVIDQRNAVYVNNAQNFTITNSIIEDSRTGIQMGNNISGGSIMNNFFRNTYTHGLMINFDLGVVNGTNLIIKENSFYGNWYSEVYYHGTNTGNFTDADFSCNWYGTSSPTTLATAAGEPGYASQVPAQFGGTAPGTLADQIRGTKAGLITTSPWLVNGTDDDLEATGFQPVDGSCGGTPLVIVTAVPDHILCGETTGSIEVNWTGGSANFTIDWVSGNATGVTGSPYTITGLAKGTYNITVTDAYGSFDLIENISVDYLPVTLKDELLTLVDYYPTIQAAIDAASNDYTVEVCAGTYVESIYINKSGIILKGPNYGKDPNIDTRVAEAIVEFTDWYGVYFDVANVTIDGLTFDGKGICDYGIYTFVSGSGGHLFANNIVKNINIMGYLGWVQSGSPSSNNLVTKNLFKDMPNARAVVTLWNYYANVTNNVIQGTSVGIYAENAHQPESTGVVEWKGNDISSSRSGIWYNLAYGNATPLTIKDNIIDVEDNPAGTRWDGMWLTSLGGSVNPVISGNIITGAAVTQQTNGYQLWNNTTTAANGITIEGGTVSGVEYGIWINNWEGYPTSGSNAGTTSALIDGVEIDNASIAGIYLKDNPLNTSGPAAFVYAKVTNSTISNSGIGILLEGEDASADVIDNPATITGNEVGIRVKDGASLVSVTGNTITNNTHGGIIIESTAGTIGLINNNTISGNGYTYDPTYGLGIKNDKATSVDATINWWGHISGPYHSAYNTCGQGNAAVGLVDISPWLNGPGGGTVDLLPVYNVDLSAYYCKIQDAIDDPLTIDGHTIQVAAGSYPENILVDKELILIGAGALSTTILAGAGVAVEVTADNVTIEGFEIKHSTVTTLADMGIMLNMSNGSSIQNNKFTMNSLGIQLLDAGSNYIYQNEFAYNAIGIYFEGTTDGLGNFDGGSNGPFYSLSLNNIVEENDIQNSVLIGGQGGQGIYLDAACEDNEFLYNTISNNQAIGYYAWKASNNTITGNLIQNNADQGLQLQGSSGNTITYNTVSGSQQGFWMRSPAEDVADNIITDNTITGNDVGLKLEDDYSTNDWPGKIKDNTISYNQIYGNTTFGLQVVNVEPGTLVDATNNWWGSNTGPTYAGNPCGTGNSVSDNVLYDCWYNNADLDYLVCQTQVFEVGGTTALCVNQSTDITLDGSQDGGSNYDYEYTLYENGILVANSETIGTGNPLSWTVTPAAYSVYTVKAVNSLFDACEVEMDGAAQVFSGPVTTAGSVLAACPGSQIQIPVTVTSFAEVGAISLTLNYDPAALTFLSSVSPVLGAALQISNTVFGGTGTIIASWFVAPAGIPLTLPDGSELFLLNFTYNGGTTNLTWNDTDPAWCEYAAFAPNYLPFCDVPTEDYYFNGQVTQVASPVISSTVTGPDGDIPMVSGNNYALTICSGEEVTTSAPSSASPDPSSCGALRVKVVYTTTISTLPPTETFDLPYATASLLPPTSITPENHDGVAKNITFVSTPYYDVNTNGQLDAGDLAGLPITFVLTVQPTPEISGTVTAPDYSQVMVSGESYDHTICSGIEITTSVPTLTSELANACGTLRIQTVYTSLLPNIPSNTVDVTYDQAQLMGPQTISPENHTGSAKTITFVSTPYYDADNSGTLSAGDITGEPTTFVLTVNPIPAVTAVDLLSSTDLLDWYAVNGDLISGYNLCIDPVVPYFYLDIDDLTAPVTALGSASFEENAFYLVGSYPTSFFDYWAAKGVISGATGWQGVMWNIINGNAPMFYINYTGSDYQLLDGLQYQIGQGANPLRISGDYPQDAYTFEGTVLDVNGCISEPFAVTIDLNTIPLVTAVNLQTSVNESSWFAVGGDLVNGYDLCIDQDNPYHYLDIDDLSGPVNPLMTTSFEQNAFKLTGIGNATQFFAYWAAKGVTSSSVGGWEEVMWQIISGVEPMFYIQYTGSDYKLIDGLQYLTGQGAQTLRITGDYPQDLYTFNGSVTDVNGCVSSFFDVFIQINTTPHMDPVADQVFCAGESVPETPLSANVPGTTFTWTNSNPDIGLVANGTGDVYAFTATNTTNAPISGLITVTPVAPSGCVGTPVVLYTITVNPTPTMTDPADQIVCNGAPTDAVVFAGPVTGTTYEWENNNPSIGLAASGSGDILSFNAINTSSVPVVATVTVTPWANDCEGIPQSFTITVNPTPNVVNPGNQALCNGANTTAVSFSGNVAGTVFDWVNDTPSIGLAASGSGDIASFAAINNGTTDIVATITVTPSANGCPGTAEIFTITVYPTPAGTAVVTTPISCSGGDATVTITATVGTAPFSLHIQCCYQW
jgi:parallel beta-helix repeat protein